MRFSFHSRPLAFAAALVVALAPHPGLAQQDDADAPRRVVNGERFGAWTVQCDAIAVNETVCVLSQRLMRNSDRAFLAQLLAFTNGDGSARYIAARVPLGVHLPSGFAMRPAEGEGVEQTDFTWQACTREICEALVEITPEQAAAMPGEGTWIGGYRPARQAEPLRFSFSMNGLAEGLRTLAESRAARAD